MREMIASVSSVRLLQLRVCRSTHRGHGDAQRVSGRELRRDDRVRVRAVPCVRLRLPPYDHAS